MLSTRQTGIASTTQSSGFGNQIEVPDVRQSEFWRRLCALLPAQELSAQVAEGIAAITAPIGLQAPRYAVSAAGASENLGRALRRSPGHVLLTGLKGVGKTTHVRELALRAAAGEIRFLAGHRFLWMDCQNVGPEDSRACLESIFTAVMSETSDPDAATIRAPSPPTALPVSGERGTPLVLCLDGLGALLKRPNGLTNKPLLRALISRSGVRLIGILSRWEYNDLIGGDADMADLFTRIEIEEPSEQTALAIARHHAARLSAEFGLRIEDRVVERTVALASTFILNECHPAKSIRILRHVC